MENITTNNTSNRNCKDRFNITCKISNYESCSDSFIPFFGYIEYKILLKTNIKRWEIKRRFKHFDELHKKLSKKIKNLPKLPQKTIFKSQEIIHDRKIKLQKYLNNLLRRDDVYNHDLIFDFIELRKEDYLLMKDNLDEDSSPENSPFSSLNKNQLFLFFPDKTNNKLKANKENDIIINDNFFYSSLNLKENEVEKSKCEKNKVFVNEFLDDLNFKKKEMTLVIRNFKEKVLFNNNKKHGFDFKSEEIYRLYFGDKTTKKSGLLFHCGDINGNVLGAEQCIELLTKLLNFEYNLNSESFVEILKLGKLDNFKEINIAFHLDSGKPALFAACCRIIKIILNVEKGITLEKLLFKKEVLIQKVHNFINYSVKEM